MMKPFIVIILIFRRRYQVQDSPSWLPHTKIMQHSGRPSFAGLMLPYECRGWLNHTYISWHSGTEVCLCLSNEADADGFILWLVGFFHKVCLRKRIIFALTLECQLSKLDFLWICIIFCQGVLANYMCHVCVSSFWYNKFLTNFD